MIVAIGIAALLQIGCGSTPTASGGGSRSNVPPEITAWRNQHSADTYSGMGISSIMDNESDAYLQATTLAREELAFNLESEIAGIAENYVKRAEGQGQSDRIAKFQNSTKQLANATVRNAKSYGPYINNNGATYIIVYLDKAGTQKDLSKYVDDVFAETENELNEMLGVKK
jgi:hypothetical protein